VALPRDANEKLAITVKSSYYNTVKLQCSRPTKIGKSEEIILFKILWKKDFYFALYVVNTEK